MTQERKEPQQVPMSYYVDVFQPWMNPYTVTLRFGRREIQIPPKETVSGSPGDVPEAFSKAFTESAVRVGVPATVVISHQVVMSPTHAKAMIMLMRKMMKAHEEHTGYVIQVPPPVLKELQLAEDDW